MHLKLYDKTKEALKSVMPISIIVLILNFTITPMPIGVRGLFLIGSILLILGMGLFTLGADMAMMPMGEHIGGHMTRTKKLALILFSCLMMGVMITVAEPDLKVLATQVPEIPTTTLIITVAIGVGVFLVVAILRIILGWRLSYLLFIFYGGVFVLAFFVPNDYLSVAFDSGGVTTGPITVPFILALGVGVAAVRGGQSSHDDSFGLVALCSIGPVVAVMILGIFFDTAPPSTEELNVTQFTSLEELFLSFAEVLPHYFIDVAVALSPIVVLFLLFQVIALRLPVSQLIKISIGVIYTYLGLVLFLTGVNTGFLPAGNFIGEYIGSLSYSWILIPLGMVMGYFIVSAEPAVHVLNSQVEDITGGAISKNMMLQGMSVGVAISVGLAMLRILTGAGIWYFLIPGYLIALALTFFVPKIFTALAFDSGGVASGPMTATFLLPFAMGACVAVGGNIMQDAFGTVALVAMTPLVTIQVMGLIYKMKLRDTTDEELETFEELIEEEEIIEWSAPDALDLVDMEFVASPEWAVLIHDDEILDKIASDNAYINFEDSDKEDS